ncbi:hypothetical protein ACHHYP_20413 [Achlya hypogyna]|uniref:Uncharacterized protein n=1 Tax=Achlya hypogyna TaxID=1202772 RepID=A0A1V9YNF9_ACHHY|nr:hypothetical protein ACHHYP_20413 [Achlya hypogyna]
MPKARFVEAPPPVFGLVGDVARSSALPKPAAPRPQAAQFLATTHGQRFVAMVAAMAELSHLNLSDSEGELEVTAAPEAPPIKPLTECATIDEPERVLYPRIKIPGPKPLKRRKRWRPKRSWKTSHATWVGTPSIDPFFVLQYDSAMERQQSLKALSALQPEPRTRLPARATAARFQVPSPNNALSSESESSSSSSSDDATDEPASAPLPTKPVRRFRPPPETPPPGNNYEPEPPAPRPKLAHVPVVLTPDMIAWLRASGMFLMKPKSQVAWTREAQLRPVGE